MPGVSTACGAGKFTCNPKVFTLRGQPTCITAKGKCSEKSESCVAEFRKRRESLGMTPDELKKWAEEASKGLGQLEATALANDSVGAHCAKRKKDKDCLALASLKEDIQKQGVKVATAQEHQQQLIQGQKRRQQAMEQDYGEKPNNWTPKGTLPPTPTARPADAPAQPIDPGSNCEGQMATNLGVLSCVACGLAANDSDAQSQGVSEFVALMGVVAQTYDGGPYSSYTASGRESLLTHVIDRISAYGFCTDQEYGSGALNSINSQRLIRNIIDGKEKTRESFLFFKLGTSDSADAAFSSLGIGPQQLRGIRSAQFESPENSGRFPASENVAMERNMGDRQPASLFGWFRRNPRTQAPSQAYAVELFNGRGDRQTVNRTRRNSPSGFNSSRRNPAQQRWEFQSQAQGHATAFPQSAFSSCTAGLQRRGGAKESFNICTPSNRGFQLNLKNYKANEKLRDALYTRCGMKAPQRQRPAFCPSACINSYAYGSGASWLRNCDSEGPGGNGPGSGGKGGESESGRGGGKGAESSGGRGGNDGGKGGESSGTR